MGGIKKYLTNKKEEDKDMPADRMCRMTGLQGKDLLVLTGYCESRQICSVKQIKIQTLIDYRSYIKTHFCSVNEQNHYGALLKQPPAGC